MERRQEISPRLKDFSKLGQLTLVEQIGQDVEELAEVVWRIEDAGLLYQVGLDPNAIGGVLDAILLKGVPEDKLVSVNQGYRLAGAIKTTERKLAEGVLVHGGTELMNWCVGNAKVKVVGNAIVITKQVSGTAKIDPLMALFNAVSLMALNPPAQINDYDFKNMVIG
jgi:phage terminase large subunit-like protein